LPPPKAPIDPLQFSVARPVPVATQGPRDATKTIIGRPESAKRLAQHDPCERFSSKPDSTAVEGAFRTTEQLILVGGGLMGLWMLSFGDRGSAIIEAETMIHARLRVAVNGLVRASLFIGGCQIDPEFIPLIPDESIGRKLSREHSSELLELLKHGPPRRSAKPGRRAIAPPVQMLALPGPAQLH
jgi:hypothetical protein